MKRSLKLTNVDCAVCAAKMERAAAKVDGVRSVSVAFMTRRITVDADESRFDDVICEIERACRRIEPDCRIVR